MLDVRILYWRECPSWEKAIERVRKVLDEEGYTYRLELLEIRTEEDALKYRFVGSPTIRIDGVDIDPEGAMSGSYGLNCRIYNMDGKILPLPTESYIRNALRAISTIRFMDEALRLKYIPRSGWWYYGIKHGESVAEHVSTTTILSLILAEYLKLSGEKVDVEKVLKIAILHELGELKLGDIHLEARKLLGGSIVDEAEKIAFRNVSSLLGRISENFMEIYEEFNEGKTKEALIVRIADKLELLMQARMYERTGYTNLEAFWSSIEAFRDMFDQGIAKHIYELLRFLRSSTSAT